MAQNRLAIHGGPKVVEIQEPHYRWPIPDEADEQAILGVLRRGELSYHRCAGEVAALENSFASLVGVKHAISMHSGTGALTAGYDALGLSPGAGVLVPAYTHLATAFSMLPVGLVPELCDVESETGNIDPVDAEARLTSRTEAIAVTHQYGHSADMERIVELSRRRNLRIIEDCSHAHGATRNGRHLGADGDVSVFSLQAHKTIWGGEGGILLTNNDTIAERACLLGHFRERRSFTSSELEIYAESGLGHKSRIHPMSAALARVQVGKLPQVVAARHANYTYLAGRIAGLPGICLPRTAAGVDRGGFFKFILFYDSEALDGLPLSQFLAALHAEGCADLSSGALVRPLHSYALMQRRNSRILAQDAHDAPCGPRVVYKLGDFPIAEHISASTLQLPAFTEPAEHLIDCYVAAMEKVIKLRHLLM
jgi:dTDP-4-amino-4,6-dideoxygalactose transaminase